MGSKKVFGIRFQCFSDNHAPAHVHAFYAGIIVILDLLADGRVVVSEREDAVRPSSAKRNRCGGLCASQTRTETR